jgi:hypothetical protein
MHSWHGEGSAAHGDGGNGIAGSWGRRCRCVSRCAWGRRSRRRCSHAAGRLDGSGRARSSRSVVESVARAVGDETRVLRNVGSTDTNEVLKCLLCLLVGLAPCLHTVDDVLGEFGVLAVAVDGRVVLAVLGADLKPRVHAAGEHVANLFGWVGRGWVAGAGGLCGGSTGRLAGGSGGA